MYLLPDNRQWDSDYFHTLISDKHIISSSEAKAIRENSPTQVRCRIWTTTTSGRYSVSAIALPKAGLASRKI